MNYVYERTVYHSGAADYLTDLEGADFDSDVMLSTQFHGHKAHHTVISRRRPSVKQLAIRPKPKQGPKGKASAASTQDVKPKQRCGRMNAPSLPPPKRRADDAELSESSESSSGTDSDGEYIPPTPRKWTRKQKLMKLRPQMPKLELSLLKEKQPILPQQKKQPVPDVNAEIPQGWSQPGFREEYALTELTRWWSDRMRVTIDGANYVLLVRMTAWPDEQWDSTKAFGADFYLRPGRGPFEEIGEIWSYTVDKTVTKVITPRPKGRVHFSALEEPAWLTEILIESEDEFAINPETDEERGAKDIEVALRRLFTPTGRLRKRALHLKADLNDDVFHFIDKFIIADKFRGKGLAQQCMALYLHCIAQMGPKYGFEGNVLLWAAGLRDIRDERIAAGETVKSLPEIAVALERSYHRYGFHTLLRHDPADRKSLTAMAQRIVAKPNDARFREIPGPSFNGLTKKRKENHPLPRQRPDGRQASSGLGLLYDDEEP